MTREEERRHNTGLAKVAVQCSADTVIAHLEHRTKTGRNAIKSFHRQ